MLLHLIFAFVTLALALPPSFNVNDELGTCPGCAIHYRDLPSVVQLCKEGKKAVCSHVICKDCAENIHDSYGSTCPLCSSYFSSYSAIDLTPSRVFDVVDYHKNKSLSLSQVKVAVMLWRPFRATALSFYLRTKWHLFDSDVDGRVTKPEFLEMCEELDEKIRSEPSRYERPDLPFRRDIDVFFKKLDFDEDGKLNKNEVKRAIMYLTRAEVDPGMKKHLDAVVELNMKNDEKMDINEFTRFYYFRVLS